MISTHPFLAGKDTAALPQTRSMADYVVPATAPGAVAPQHSSFVSKATSGLAVVGRVHAVVGAVIGAIVVLIIMIVGVMMMFSPYTATAEATAMATNTAGVLKCTKETFTTAGKNGTKHTQTNYRCEVPVVFPVPSAGVGGAPTTRDVHTVVKMTRLSPITAGHKLQVRYVPTLPTKATVGPNTRAIGRAMFGGGAVLAGIIIGWTYLVLTSKKFAAYEGAVTGVEMARRLL